MTFPLIFILGPTAIGKTEVAIELARRIDAEIGSLDSRQVYRDMDIGTAKPTAEEQHAIRHHLVDCADIREPFSVAEYQNLADAAILDIHARNRRVIVAGGAGLYFRSLVDGLFWGPGANLTIRTRLRGEAEKYGASRLHERLCQCDPASGSRIHPNNLMRIIRALEVYELSGKPISQLQKQWRSKKVRYTFSAFGLNMPRPGLYSRIEKRVDRMIEDGLVEEVKGILEHERSRDCGALKSFGYKEIIDYIDRKMTIDEAVELLKRNTRRFAKRQLTWFRNDPRLVWLDRSQYSSIDQMVDSLVQQIDV